MGEYSRIVTTILQNGRPVVVRVGNFDVPAVEYRGYYVIGTLDGPKIFDGEHVIEPDFRVFDVHLRQYIYYDYPVEKLFETFGVGKKSGVNDVIREVSLETGYPPNIVRLKLIISFLNFAIFIVTLYMLFTKNPAYYYMFVVVGALSLVDALIDKKYRKKINGLGLFFAVLILLTGVYGIIFKL